MLNANINKTLAFCPESVLDGIHIFRGSKIELTFKKHTILSMFSKSLPAELPSVGIVYYYAGANVQLLTMMAKIHQGIVIIGSGSGNYSH